MQNALLDLLRRPREGLCTGQEIPFCVQGSELDAVLEFGRLVRTPFLNKEEEADREKRWRKEDLQRRLLRSPKFKRLARKVLDASTAKDKAEKCKALQELCTFIGCPPLRLGRGKATAFFRDLKKIAASQ